MSKKRDIRRNAPQDNRVSKSVVVQLEAAAAVAGEVAAAGPTVAVAIFVVVLVGFAYEAAVGEGGVDGCVPVAEGEGFPAHVTLEVGGVLRPVGVAEAEEVGGDAHGGDDLADGGVGVSGYKGVAEGGVGA